MLEYLKLMRVHQWIKNFFVFGAIVFSMRFLDHGSVVRSLFCFLLFCLMSSFVYILNDTIDREQDRAHPTKCNRPLAKGTIRVSHAIVLAVVLLLAALFGSFRLDPYLSVILLLYLSNNLLYSFVIKHVVLLDIFSIAIGFVLRVLAGGIAIGVRLSPWIILCTLFLSLFLGSEKRRAELNRQANRDSHSTRKTLGIYRETLLLQISLICAGCAFLFYALYTVLVYPDSWMYLTNVFVIYGIFRYLLLTMQGQGEDTAELLLKDKPLLIDVTLWIISCIIILTRSL